MILSVEPSMAVLLDVEVVGERLLLGLVAAAHVVAAALVGHQLPGHGLLGTLEGGGTCGAAPPPC